MNTVSIIPLLLVAAICLPGGLIAGWCAHVVYRRERQAQDPLSVDGLAERADINGSRMVAIARQMDESVQHEGDTLRAAELRCWSRELKRFAYEHLQCVNALTLDSLHAVGIGPVHLGDWRKPDSQKAADPERMRRWGDAAGRNDFIQRGASHG